MSIQSKPDYKIFAQDAKSGEIDTFPDILRGWGVTIDRTGEIPPMEWFNAIGKRVDEWLLYLTQRGIPEWDSSLDYPKTAMVQYAGIYYVSLKATKAEQPNNSQASWSTLSAFLGLGNYYNKAESDTKYQPKGNYAPAGDYATNTALNNGLALKFDKAGGTITGDVTFSKNAIKSTKGTHTLPEKSGTLMQVGDYGIGIAIPSIKTKDIAKDWSTRFVATPGEPSVTGGLPWGVGVHIAEGEYGCVLHYDPDSKILRTCSTGKANAVLTGINTVYSTANTTKDSNGFLRESGTANALTTGNVVQTTGQSTTNVMSQKAVTDLIGSMAIGIGQTWQNMLDSRKQLTNYTNATDRPIFVYIKFLGDSSGVENAITVDGITVGFASGNNTGVPNTIIVPPGSVYRVNTGRVVSTWSELR